MFHNTFTFQISKCLKVMLYIRNVICNDGFPWNLITTCLQGVSLIRYFIFSGRTAIKNSVLAR